MDTRRIRWTAAFALAFAALAVLDLVTLFALPLGARDTGGRVFLLRTILAGVTLLVALPFLFGLYERQQERIEEQKRELETLHALDMAILSEMELPRILKVAVGSVLRAVNAEAGGIVVFAPKNEGAADSEIAAEAYSLPDSSDEIQARFARMTRSGDQEANNATDHTILLPLRDSDHDIGYIAAGRFVPGKPFTASEEALLQTLGGTISIAVTNSRALETAREAARLQLDLERERRVAEALTEGLLPEMPGAEGNWAFSRCYRAQGDEAQVGGDIYDLFELRGGRLGVVIADVSGKGLKAARQTAMVKYSLRSYAREHASPANVLSRLNNALFEEPYLTGFVTLLYAVLDTQGTFTYASAGHEPPILRRSNREMLSLNPTGMVLGVERNMEYEENVLTIAPGDGVLLYTDGLSEGRDHETGNLLGTTGVEAWLRELPPCAPQCVTDNLLERLRAYSGGHFTDDVAMVWVERVEDAARQNGE